jgi:hypothetical protein
MLDIKTLRFISRSKKLYGSKFKYVKTKYVNSRTNVIITCPLHGDFTISPNNHLNSNRSCKKCKQEKRLNFEYQEFLRKASVIHKFKYNYDKVHYVNNKTKVIIICPLHGMS